MAGKVDFRDFIAQLNNQFGTTEGDWNQLAKTAIVTFEYDDKRDNISGKYKGVPVFRHREYENTILAGETWICKLDGSHDNYHFATPVQKVDASFLFELKKDQIDEIAETVWKNHEGAIRPSLEERYHDMMIENVSKAVEDAKSGFKAEVDDLNAKIRTLEQRDAESKQIIASLEEKAKAVPVYPVKITPGGMPQMLPSVQTLAPVSSVRRTSPDAMQSEFFTQSRYFIHVSADHRIIVIRPHAEGNVVCMDNTITLEGLSIISSFNEPYDMVSEYSSEYGGLLVHLK
ncbi:MAG: hypothetical protein LBS92_01510 [Candidatus Methanoplasma sp.]|jgi:hypothetical protein|nr:hypothetical protein [Candidatus Methanoplasma sp.]